MQHKSLRTVALGLATAAALTLAAAAADTPNTMAGNGVTFVNGSNHRIEIFTRYGSDAACDAKPQSKNIVIDAGQNGVVDSGSSSVCFCLKVPDRGTCPSGGWGQVKAGGTRHLM
jgi:hypothetical protein